MQGGPTVFIPRIRVGPSLQTRPHPFSRLVGPIAISFDPARTIRRVRAGGRCKGIGQFQMLGRLTPRKHRVVSLMGKVLYWQGERYALDKRLPKPPDCKHTAIKLHTVVVDHGGMLSIVEIAPIHDGEKADMGMVTGPHVQYVCPLCAMQQRNRLTSIEADCQFSCVTLPAGNYADTGYGRVRAGDS